MSVCGGVWWSGRSPWCRAVVEIEHGWPADGPAWTHDEVRGRRPQTGNGVVTTREFLRDRSGFLSVTGGTAGMPEPRRSSGLPRADSGRRTRGRRPAAVRRPAGRDRPGTRRRRSVRRDGRTRPGDSGRHPVRHHRGPVRGTRPHGSRAHRARRRARRPDADRGRSRLDVPVGSGLPVSGTRFRSSRCLDCIYRGRISSVEHRQSVWSSTGATVDGGRWALAEQSRLCVLQKDLLRSHSRHRTDFITWTFVPFVGYSRVADAPAARAATRATNQERRRRRVGRPRGASRSTSRC